jgi:hypothetical protein
MKKFLPQLAFFSILLLTAASSQAEYYCWNNDDDIQECGYYVPEQYSQKGFRRLTQSGLWEDVKPAPTKEELAEIARKEEEERLRLEQEKEDNLFLETFGSEQDIENSRSAGIDTIDGQIKSFEEFLKVQQRSIKSLEESYKENALLPDIQKIIMVNIESVKKAIKESEKNLKAKRLEKETIEKEHDSYLERYRNIMRYHNQ